MFTFLFLFPRLEPINLVNELADCLSQVHCSEQEQVLTEQVPLLMSR